MLHPNFSNGVGSPKKPTKQTPQDDDSSLNMASPSGYSLIDPPTHQGDEITGGNSNSSRVLFCSNLDITLDYSDIFLIMKQHGRVEKIKLKAVDKGKSYDSYVLFSSPKFANLAHKYLNGHSVNEKNLRTKLFNEENVNFGPQDFIPAEMDPAKPPKKIERNLPDNKWFVAEYKNGGNFMKATKWIKWKIGNIEDKNLKRYGKAILIEADDDTRASLLTNFKPPADGNIKSVTPHRTFNLTKGIVHSRDLYEFSEEEILEMCPENIYRVQKLKGANNSILMFFSNRFLPEYITVCNSRLRVKKFRPNPKQCRQCLDYGHVKSVCPNKEKCLNCSVEYEGEHRCSNIKFCFHCSGDHGPTSRNCARYRFEQDIVAIAEDEHISFGSAKRRVLGANKDPSSTYASVVRQVKTIKTQGRPNSSDTVVASAVVHNPLASRSNVTKKSTSPSRPKDAFKTKSKFTELDDGFWVPPTPKTIKHSSPKIFNIDTSNQFSMLEKSNSLMPAQSMKVTSRSCSNLDALGTSDCTHTDSLDSKNRTETTPPQVNADDAKVLEIEVSKRRREQENGTPPKSKKSNKGQEIELEEKIPMECESQEGAQSQPHTGNEGKSSHPLPPPKDPLNEEISPSPIIGQTGKPHYPSKHKDGKTGKNIDSMDISDITPSPIIGAGGKKVGSNISDKGSSAEISPSPAIGGNGKLHNPSEKCKPESGAINKNHNSKGQEKVGSDTKIPTLSSAKSVPVHSERKKLVKAHFDAKNKEKDHKSKVKTLSSKRSSSKFTL